MDVTYSDYIFWKLKEVEEITKPESGNSMSRLVIVIAVQCMKCSDQFW